MHQPTGEGSSRIRFLDGMRGLAILLVIGYHAYARHPDIMPYGSRFLHFPLFHYGWLGVQLFFLISGFVIFLTLEKSKGFVDFMMRRWMRLFPAMLVCSLVVYLTFTFLMPDVRPISLRAMLPGLSFIEPRVWGEILGSPQPLLEGAFWSLYVEVRFYIFAGALFFLLGEVAAIAGIIAMFLVASSINLFSGALPVPLVHAIEIFRLWTFAEHFGWFAAGALYFRFFQTRSTRMFMLATAVALLSVLATSRGNASVAAVALSIVVFFAVSVYGLYWRFMRHLLESRVLLFVGFISYPLYLIHENIMLHLVLKLANAVPGFPEVLLPLLPVLVVIALGAVIAMYVEPAIGRMIRPWYSRARIFLRVEKTSRAGV